MKTLSENISLIAKLHRDREGGFTLIELMVVVTIIAILASIGLPALTKFVRKSETTDAITVLGAIDQAIQAYASIKGVSVANTDIGGKTDDFGCSTAGTACALSNALAGFWGKPLNTKFSYTASAISADSNGAAVFTLKATGSTLAGSQGVICWASAASTAAGWDGKANYINYIGGGAGCTT